MSTPNESRDLETEAAVVRDLAQQAFTAEHLDPGLLYLVADGPGRQRLVDTDAYGEEPRRAEAAREFYDAASFARYLDRHAMGQTEVFADVQHARVVAVLDSHLPEQPGWQKHRATLTLTQSPAWKAWLARDGDLIPQVEFAEFIELNAADVRTPAPTDLLDLAQTFEATKAVEYESSERLADGQTRLGYRETVTAKAGQKGDVEIPQSLTLGVRPYIGGPLYAVTARFRYRIDREQHLRLGYVIERPQVILDAAFEDVLVMLRKGRDETAPGEGDEVPAVQAPIYLGRPSL
jgi:uncharacterized protein YfdQ (DUF2303 family)